MEMKRSFKIIEPDFEDTDLLLSEVFSPQEHRQFVDKTRQHTSLTSWPTVEARDDFDFANTTSLAYPRDCREDLLQAIKSFCSKIKHRCCDHCDFFKPLPSILESILCIDQSTLCIQCVYTYVYAILCIGQEYTDCINASFIDSYRQKDYFITTQGPLPHTVEDFWRMVWEWKCHTILMLMEVQECEQEKCFQYWPAEGSMTHGQIHIELKRDTISKAISVWDFLVTFNQEKKNRLVRQFHFHSWPEIGIPAEGKGMIDLIAAVQKQQQQMGNDPITVYCSARVGQTGTFIALSNILDQVKAEGLLDVFQAVKSLRLQRPHMVQTLERHEFCYKVVQDFSDIFSDYANFK
ncbi:receptor-type tyrosine-protein phosphatase epsilon-like [Monodelphis domestica]|uniref:receptor-type tyrosine-protein phosphatase epsilon-like n=1 Tax=Monodelphis domestica TaxID=13616 RepID=UPI0024E251D8|nr:receptor-type tyrosine-protein phosphatase epsilon-like [Monodelphis domestica]